MKCMCQVLSFEIGQNYDFCMMGSLDPISVGCLTNVEVSGNRITLTIAPLKEYNPDEPI